MMGDSREEIKTQFLTREGVYRLMTLSEYSRPNSNNNNNNNPNRLVSSYAPNNSGGGPVKVSFVGGRITFNYGRELFVYPFGGLKRPENEKPIDKRVYKGTFPTCHHFDSTEDEEEEEATLAVGFSGGQIQLIDPAAKEAPKLYNEERLVDKTKVTCVKWLPSSRRFFMVSHASGRMYVYNRDLARPPASSTSPPVYQLFKRGEGYAVYTCKAKTTRNPVFKWAAGEGAVNEFAFSPCGRFLAVASQDGYLRVFNYDAADLVGVARSYFGGLTCVCWSPDGKYVACGGEDDLVTVYGLYEKRVVARGQGHKSWVSVVAFDQYNTSYGEPPDGLDFSGSDEEDAVTPERPSTATSPRREKSGDNVTCYRFGSVGQDTYICLWDITEDVLKRGSSDDAFRRASPDSSLGTLTSGMSNSNSLTSKDSGVLDGSSSSTPTTSLTQKLASLNFGDKKKNASKGARGGGAFNGHSFSSSSSSSSSSSAYECRDEPVKLGSPQCPRLHEIPVIEPLIVKKIAHERLTALIFREECLVTACQDGYICTWARPGRVNGSGAVINLESPRSSGSGCCNNHSSVNGCSSSSATPGDGGTIV